MKRAKNYYLYFLAALALLNGCKGNEIDPLSEDEQKIKLLSREWKLSSATVDGRNVMTEFAGLEVSFLESKSFIVKNAVPPIWTAAGSFELIKSGSNYLVKRSDGMNLTLVSLSESAAVLNINYTAPSGARHEGISGAYTFTFLPK